MITVALFSNQPVLVAGLRVLIAETSDLTVVAAAEYPPGQALQGIAPPPAVVIVDLAPGANLELVSQVCVQNSRSAVLVLSRVVSPELTYQARECGAAAVISTDAAPAVLLNVIRRIANGEIVFEEAADGLPGTMKRFHLSPREGQLVVLLAQGLKNKEIATVLGITEGTVKVYLSKLFQKIGAKDRFELALFGLKNYGQGTLGFQLGPRAREVVPQARRPVISLKTLLARPSTQPAGLQHFKQAAGL